MDNCMILKRSHQRFTAKGALKTSGVMKHKSIKTCLRKIFLRVHYRILHTLSVYSTSSQARIQMFEDRITKHQHLSPLLKSTGEIADKKLTVNEP